MRASSKVNDDCMAEFEALIRPGITEKEMAEAIRGIYAAHGCSGVSFSPSAVLALMRQTLTTTTTTPRWRRASAS